MIFFSRSFRFILLSWQILPLLALSSSISRQTNNTMGYGTIKINKGSNGVTRVTFNNPPVNIWSWRFAEDLYAFMNTLDNNNETKVVIFDSALPDYFIAHYDLAPQDADAPPLDVQINHLKDGILFKLSKLPTIFIVEIAGRAHGIGSEFIAQCDIRFAARGKTFISQFEVTLGLLPGAGGIPFLLQNIGRGKTLEYALSGLDIDADTAEKIGVVNHAYEPHDLRSKVDEYANLIAKFESQALATVKERINAYSRPQESMINVDNADFFRIAAEPRVQELVKEFLVLTKNQSDNEYEKDIEKIVPKLYG